MSWQKLDCGYNIKGRGFRMQIQTKHQHLLDNVTDLWIIQVPSCKPMEVQDTFSILQQNTFELDVPAKTSYRHDNRLTGDKKDALTRGAQDETQMRGFIITSLSDWLASLEDCLYGLNSRAGDPAGSLECLQKRRSPRKFCWKRWHLMMSMMSDDHQTSTGWFMQRRKWFFRYESTGLTAWARNAAGLGFHSNCASAQPAPCCNRAFTAEYKTRTVCWLDGPRPVAGKQHNYTCEGLKRAAKAKQPFTRRYFYLACIPSDRWKHPWRCFQS